MRDPHDKSKVECVVLRDYDDNKAPMTQELHVEIVGGTIFLNIMREEDCEWVGDGDDRKCNRKYIEIASFATNYDLFVDACKLLTRR